MAGSGYDKVLEGKLAEFVKLSSQIGGDVEKQAVTAKQAFDAQKEFLNKAAGQAKPSQDALVGMLKPTSEKISDVEELYNAKRGVSQPSGHYVNHLASVSEGIGALGWVGMGAVPPGTFVQEKINATQFYTDRVLKEFKDKDLKHVEWVDAFIGALKELGDYTKEHHRSALTWGK